MNVRRFTPFALGLSFALAIAGVGEPLARAEDPTQKILRLGFVSPNSPSNALRFYIPFWDRLHELGWIEGQNLVVERRWAENRNERLPELMAEIITLNVDVIFTVSTPAAIAAKNATSTIPIVVVAMGDPVRSGLVSSLARPGGNLTGMSMGYGQAFGGKWLELLQETVPRLSTVAVILNPNNSVGRDLARELEAIAPKRNLKVQVIEVREAEALDGAFDQARRQAQAVLVHGETFTLQNRQKIIALAAKHRLPAMYNLLTFTEAGGLMAYSPDLAVQFRHAAEQVDKILRGAMPANLPIEQPTEYLLVVNLKTAKALGLTIPQSILLQADEVIR